MNKKFKLMTITAITALLFTGCTLPGSKKTVDDPTDTKDDHQIVAEESKKTEYPEGNDNLEGSMVTIANNDIDLKIAGLEDGTQIVAGKQKIMNYGPGEINELEVGGETGNTRFQMDSIQPLRIETVGATTQKVTLFVDSGSEIAQTSAGTFSKSDIVPNNYIVTYSAGGYMTNTISKFDNASPEFSSKVSVASTDASKLGLELGYDYAVISGNINLATVNTFNIKTEENVTYQIESTEDSVLMKADSNGEMKFYRSSKPAVKEEERGEEEYSKMTGIKISDYNHPVIANKIEL